MRCRLRVRGGTIAAFTVVAALGVWGGYQFGLDRASTELGVGGPVAPELFAMVERQRDELEREQRRAQIELNALAQRLGRLQGEMLRLNALGERLVEMADLDSGEFDFASEPPLGGPESTQAADTDIRDLVRDLGSLSGLLEDRGRKLSLLEDVIMTRQLDDRIVPSGKPVREGWISSFFGNRADPKTGQRTFHKGIDFVAKLGSEVVAVADGVVEFSGWRSGYGRTVEIRHVGGYVTRYAHNSKLLVGKGDLVRQGQNISLLGASGRTTGPHLHFEVLREGKPIDPLGYVQSNGRLADDRS